MKLRHLIAPSTSGKLELVFGHLVVGAFFCDEFGVGALFGDLAFVHEEDLVGLEDGGEAVGDEDEGFAAAGGGS